MLLVGILATACADEPPAKDKKKPNFTIGKETTFVTGPVDKDGYIDYAAALNERLGKGVTPETNANVLIWKALGPKPDGGKGMPAKFFKLMGMDEPPEKGDYFIELTTFLHDQLKIEDAAITGAIERQRLVASGSPWAEKEYPEIAKWLKANEKPLDQVVEATKRPHYFCPILPDKTESGAAGIVGAILSGNLQAFRKLTTTLASRAMQRVNDGEFDEAWTDLLACHRLARFVGRGGTTIEGIVAVAVESIAQRADVVFLERFPKDSKKLKQRLNELRSLPQMVRASEQFGGGERLVQLAQATHSAATFPGNWDPALRNLNRWYDRIAKAASESDHQTRINALTEIEDELTKVLDDAPKSKNEAQSTAMTDIWVKLAVPAFRKAIDASDRAEQGERNLLIAFALAIYLIDEGSYPKSLGALAPKYLDTLPKDLFTGKPLVYRPNENGYLLYSLGPDGKDDEGRGLRDTPKGDDIAIRMPVAKLVKK